MMRSRFILGLLAITFLAIGAFSLALDISNAHAQGVPSSPAISAPIATSAPDGGTTTCSSYNDAKGAVLGTIIPCLAHTIEAATIRMAAEMSALMQPAFWAFVVLAVSFQGVLALQGERQIGPRIFIFLVKLAVIIPFADSLNGMIPDIFSIMRASEDIMVDALLPPNPENQFQCDFTQYLPSDRPGHILWAEFDCILGKVLGFAVGGDGKPSMILAASVLGLMGGFFFGGTFGLSVFFAAVAFLWGLLTFVVRSGFAYANAYLFAALYAALAPIFVPMALLQSTSQYFQNWLRGLIGTMIMPVVVTAYAIFALIIFDKLLFRDGSDGQPKSALYQLFDYERIKEIQRNPQTINAGTLITDQVALAQQQGIDLGSLAVTQDTKNRNSLNPAATAVGNLQISVPNLEMERMRFEGLSDDDVAKEKKIYTQLLIDLMKLFILSSIILSGWKMVTGMLIVLTGSGGVSAGISAVSKIEKNFQSATQSAQGAAISVMQRGDGQTGEIGPGGASGADFLRLLPKSLQEGGSQFLGGISR